MDRIATLLMSSERPCHDSVFSVSAKRRLTEYKVKIISLFKRKRTTKVCQVVNSRWEAYSVCQ